ncbi:MAG TPA: SLC13 family permease [Blastocatellia bacterium]|jgi:di/tricarboxylate transporter|nr:SLC13 family permease [Blastocatellia bacterium]
MQIAIVLGLLVIAVALFATEKLSIDVITLLLLLALVLTGILAPSEAFKGFSDDIIVILGSIFVISGALQRSGIMDAIGAGLHRYAGGSRNRLIFFVMAIVGGVSSFMNNTTATAIFVPPVIGIAKQSKISASKLLMPLAFASILGGTCTLIGTSTNVAVSGYIARSGMQPLGLFEITPIGVVILVAGIGYMMLVGQRMLPDYKDESLTEEYAMREYLSEIVVMPNSHLVGQRIFESDLSRMDFRVLEVLRGREKFLPNSRTRIDSGDVLLVEGKVSDLIKVKEIAGIEIKADVKLGDRDLESDEIKIVEVLVTPQSDLIDRTLKESNFRARYGMAALAINRHGHSLREKIGLIRLRMGDLLLIQGPADRLDDIRRHPDLWILEELNPALYKKSKGFYTLGFFISAVIAGGLGVVPLSIAFLGAAVLTILFRCITAEEAYEFIDWRLIILIGGMTAFGTAMDDKHTGAAGFLANLIVAYLQPYGEMVILAGFFVITMVLTQPMSNAAAALVVLPVALETAQRLGANERTFAIAIMLAASVSFVTPFEPSCILVYGPGKYKFLDFVKVGILLTLLLLAIILFMVPYFWPLHPMPGQGTG